MMDLVHSACKVQSIPHPRRAILEADFRERIDRIEALRKSLRRCWRPAPTAYKARLGTHLEADLPKTGSTRTGLSTSSFSISKSSM